MVALDRELFAALRQPLAPSVADPIVVKEEGGKSYLNDVRDELVQRAISNTLYAPYVRLRGNWYPAALGTLTAGLSAGRVSTHHSSISLTLAYLQ